MGYLYNGLIGVAWGAVISSLITSALYLFRAHYHKHLDFNILMRQIWRPVVASAIMVGGVHGVRQIVITMMYGSSIEVGAMVVTGVIVYIVVLLGLWWGAGKPEGIESRLLTIAFETIKKLRKVADKPPHGGA